MNLKPIQKKVEFNPQAFESTKLRNDVNCYFYAINIIPEEEQKRNVGTFSKSYDELFVTDDKLIQRFIKDMIVTERDPHKINLSAPTLEGYYKVAMFSNYGDTRSSITDFHFARQDEDGNWSHKLKGKFPERIDPQEFENLKLCRDLYHLVGIFLIKKR